MRKLKKFEIKLLLKIHIKFFNHLLCNSFFDLLLNSLPDPFCVLCVTFAPSAFLKSDFVLGIPTNFQIFISRIYSPPVNRSTV